MSNKQWPTVGYIKDGDTGPFMKLDKNVKMKVNGKKLDLQYVNITQHLSVYDKETREETEIGKIITTKKNDKISTFIQFNDNVEFGDSNSKFEMSGLGFLQTKGARLKQLDKAVQDGNIDEATAEKVREAISYSKYQVVLPPPKD